MSTEKSAFDQAAWRALDYINLYRIFIGALVCAMVFSPVENLLQPRSELITNTTAVALLGLSLIQYFVTRFNRVSYRLQAIEGLAMDMIAISALVYGVGGLGSALPVLYLPVIAATSLLITFRAALLVATVATFAVLAETAYLIHLESQAVNPVPAGMYGLVFFATALIGYFLRQRSRESEALARRRGIDLANLEQLNAMIIQRMRSGVMVIDGNGGVRVQNESAWYLLGMPESREDTLRGLSPELAQRWERWRATGEHDNHPLMLADGVPATVPRFAAFTPDPEAGVVMFLEDASMVSRRAEEMTLASLGQLSASIAHEIRNPLSAIKHAAQLGQESEEMSAADKRLVDIIVNHCERMDRIIENVLRLARREASQPENINLSDWARRFVREFHELEHADQVDIELHREDADVRAMFDLGQLQQVVWNLCHNAIKHGAAADGSTRIEIVIRFGSNQSGPRLDVIDQGAGVPADQVSDIFQPFYSGAPDGTGLGLYLSRQLCAANQAELTYQPAQGGGSQFTIHFTAPRRHDSLRPSLYDGTAKTVN